MENETTRQIAGLTARMRAEDTLRVSEERYRSLVAFSSQIVWTTTAKGEVIEDSPSWRACTGQSWEECRGLGWMAALHAGDRSRVTEAFRQALKNRSPLEMECRLRRSDGEYGDFRVRGIPILEEDGRVREWVGMCTDITDRKRAERTLEIRARQQAVVADLGRQALSGAEPAALMQEAAADVARTLEAEYCEVLELLPEGNALLLRAGVGWKEGLVGHATVDAGPGSQAGLTLLCGEPVIVEDLSRETRFLSRPLQVEHGVVCGLSVIIGGPRLPFGVLGAHTTRRRSFNRDDVNFIQGVANVLAHAIDRKRAEEVLRQSEEGFRALVENSSDGIALFDAGGRIQYASPACVRILGYPIENLVGRIGLDLVHPEDRAAAEEASRRCLESSGVPERAELRARHRDGWWRYLEFVAVNRLSRPGIGAVVVNVRDVSDRRWAEEGLQDSNEFNREIISSAGEGIVVYDRSLRCLVWNGFMEELTGMPAALVIGRPVLEIFPHLREHGGEGLLERALAGETVSAVDMPYRVPRSDKSGWVSSTYGPHRNAQGEIVGVIGIVRDVTEHKASEEALKGSERQFRAIFESAHDAVLILDDEARLVDANPAACQLYDRSRRELLGHRIVEFRTADDDFEGVWRSFLDSGHARAEVRLVRPDGTSRDVEFVATANFLPGRHLTIQRDVTERHRAERRAHAFSELGRKLSSSLTAAEAAKVIAGCADDLWHWDACTVDLYSEDSDRVDPLLTVDTINGERLSVATVIVNDAPSPRHRRVLREGAQVLLREEPVTDSDAIPFGDTARLSRSILIAPIRSGTSVIGFISVQSNSPNAYDEGDVESLQTLADLCGDALARIRAFEELRRGEQKLREAQAIGRIGIWERDLRDGSVIWSREVYEFFGLDPRHFRPTLEAMIERVLPEDRLAVEKVRQDAVRDRRPFQQEYRIRKEDSSVAVIQSRGEVILDEAGEPVRMVGVAHEVTEQRRVEERLRRSSEELRALSQKLGAVREEESARIAREVHDEVGQALTALKLDLSWVGKRLGRARRGGETDLQPKLAAMAGLIDTTLDAVQRISTELRPGVLHELGLEAAVGWYAREFQKRTEIACRFHSNLGGTSSDDNRSTAAFRILQEILTNVARHAEATEVEISLGRENGSLVLEARDNGKGISEDRISDSRSLGLLGMRERARSFGGSVAIRGRSGEGTTVTVRIPL